MFRKVENLNFFEESLWVWDVITPLKLVYHIQQNQVLLVQTSATSLTSVWLEMHCSTGETRQVLQSK